MYKIYIDTTERFNKKIKVVDLTNDAVTYEKTGEFDVVNEIQQFIKSNDISTDDIEEIVPNTGPGSFTGIKNGVTIANIFNWALNKKDLNNLRTPEYGQEPNIQKPKT